MKRIFAFLMVLLLVLLPGCITLNTTRTPSVSTASPTQAVKPKVSVVNVSASTSGQLDYYYAILDIDVKNDGADGTAVIIAGVTQGTETKTLEYPINLTKNSKQMVRLVFPLKWRGGDWVPSVRVEVP